ncbi:MAG: branched-chain amino acid transport system substrate-binding protein [Frankiales bacterium]|nr:branched-chain amino acid transport system substrate-binding protein [Frankiales bacterium]
MRRLALPVVLALGVVGCTSTAAAPRGDALVVVSAPLSSSAWVGDFVSKGAKLAVAQVNAGHGRHLRLEVLDNGGSAQTTVAQARKAVSDGAVAFITDGVGAKAVAAVTNPVKLPVFITFEGGASLTDPVKLPTLFRLAPANEDLCRRLADYLADVRRGQSIALISDDSEYGVEGAANVKADLLHDELKVVAQQTIPSGARDVSAQVLAARRSGAKVLVVWARAAGVAAVIRTARSSGWGVPVYTGPAGEDPLVRQQLADRPQWLDGTVFVSFRITSETGGAPFAAFRKVYEKAYGTGTFGVKSDGKPVQQPPDWSMYSYDAVNLVEAALNRAKVADRTKVYEGIQSIVITGANGDERGYGPDDREGVSPDDMYFGYFKGMRFFPKLDDKLSTLLPVVPQ